MPFRPERGYHTGLRAVWDHRERHPGADYPSPPQRPGCRPSSAAVKILVVEDDAATLDYVANGLGEHGHVVDRATNGRDGLFMAEGGSYDLLIIDRMLPVLDGLAVVKTLRGLGMHTPILFLTTMDGVDDRVEGLNAGGDDYLVKPFAFTELLARTNTLLRRPPLSSLETALRVGDLELDPARRFVTRGGRAIELQPREFLLLEYLMRHAGRVVTRTMVLEHVWDFNFDPSTNIVDTHVSRLRGKIGRPGEPELIRTVRGAGYMIHECG